MGLSSGAAASTSHVECSAEERARMGIPEGLIRYSTGVEGSDDLIADLEQALGAETPGWFRPKGTELIKFRGVPQRVPSYLFGHHQGRALGTPVLEGLHARPM